jgi:hypothetical protein
MRVLGAASLGGDKNIREFTSMFVDPPLHKWRNAVRFSNPNQADVM